MFQGGFTFTNFLAEAPVIVAKGVNPGKKVLISAGVHGDELSAPDIAQRSLAELDPAKMSGTVDSRR